MNTQSLIIMVLSIVVVVGAAYIVISPKAERALTGDASAPTPPAIEGLPETAVVPETVSPPTNVPVSSRTDDDDDDWEDDDDDDDRTPSTQGSTQTSPTSPSVPAPLPAATSPSGYTLAEVSLHANAASCWSVVNGKVYDLTAFISKHPGGEKRILGICGKDGSSAFNNQHGGEQRPEDTLAAYRIGALIK